MSQDDEARLSVPVTKADHIAGGAAALVTLIEYGDYQCPFCGQAYPIVKEIQRQLGTRLRFVFRNFPLTNAHPFAEAAAEAAEAAAVQGKIWEMHDLLYENQANLGPQLLVEAASTLSLDVPLFLGDMKSRKYKDRVRRDFMGGVRSGVNGTPGFFVNDTRFEGSWASDELAETLAALARG
jgi:protein-disulfide isomerase